MQANAHENAYWDYVMAEIMAVLAPLGEWQGWGEWSRYAARGEWV